MMKCLKRKLIMMNKVINQAFNGRHGNALMIALLLFVFTSSLIFFIELLLWNRTSSSSHQQRHIQNFMNDDDDKYFAKYAGDTKTGKANTIPPKDDAKWQNVTGTDNKFYVYSAYLDDRQYNTIIRVLAVTTTRTHSDVNCMMHYDDRTINIEARVQIIKENWNLKYSAAFVSCPVQRQNFTHQYPNSISIVADYDRPISNHLVIHKSANQRPSRIVNKANQFEREIVACIKPLHFYYNDAARLIEFVELNRILGVNHFTFYNHTIGPQVDCILRNYIRSGIVTVLPWQLDIESQVEIRTEAMFAALNDCLYRNMYRFRFVMIIDLDEIIVPKMHDTVTSLVRYLEIKYPFRTSASFSFQNAFFYLQWPDDPLISHLVDGNTGNVVQSGKIERNLMTMKKTRRMFRPHPHRQRSKYICRAKYVVEIGNHFVWQFIGQYTGLNVNPTYALLHHYRICEFGGNDCVNANSTTDRTIHRYRSKLVQNFADKWSALQHVCHLENL